MFKEKIYYNKKIADSFVKYILNIYYFGSITTAR